MENELNEKVKKLISDRTLENMTSHMNEFYVFPKLLRVIIFFLVYILHRNSFLHKVSRLKFKN